MPEKTIQEKIAELLNVEFAPPLDADEVAGFAQGAARISGDSG